MEILSTSTAQALYPEAETVQDFGLPKDKLFYKLSEIKAIGLMSVERAKQLLYNGELTGVKNGVMWLVPRDELIRYLNEDMVQK